MPGPVLPEQLQAELHLARGGGRAGNRARGARQAGRGKHNKVRRVEIRAIQQVEDFRAKLQVQTLANRRVFQHGEIPSGESGTDIRVPADVAIEAAVRRGRQKFLWGKPLAGVSKNNRPLELWRQERPYRISGGAVV